MNQTFTAITRTNANHGAFPHSRGINKGLKTKAPRGRNQVVLDLVKN